MHLKQFIFSGILLLIIIVPLWDTITRDTFRQKLKYVMPAIFVSAFLFLLWDIRFTEVGIWNYDPTYTLGLFHKSLPLEEWLFYLIIPYSAMWLYEILKKRLHSLNLNNVFTVVSLLLVAVSAFVAYRYRMRIYSFFVFLFTTIYLAYTIFRKQFKTHLTHFFLTYFLMLIPYFILNGILTWNLAIEYHQEQILNIWLGMMPIENLVFLFLLLLINTTVYEYLSKQKFF